MSFSATTRRGATVARGASGYTLLELIVVLAIMGIVFAVAVPNLANALRTDPRDRALAVVTEALATARESAVRNGGTARAAIVPGGGGIELATGRIALDPGTTLEAAVGEEVVAFHPTGLSSGARWRIRVPGEEPITLVVSPLDGAVRRDP